MLAIPLNHFFLVPGHFTYDEIRRNLASLQEIAAFDERKSSSQHDKWSGIYGYCTNTYFEFLSPADAAGRQVGDFAIALGTERSGELAEICKGLYENHQIEIKPQLIFRRTEGREIPWFYYAEFKSNDIGSSFALWFMEYHPDYLKTWYSLDRETVSTDRKSALQLARKSLPVADLAQNSDVTALSFQTPERSVPTIVKWLRALGYEYLEQNNHILLSAPDFAIRIFLGHKFQLQAAEITRTKSGEISLTIGSSVLKSTGEHTAEWRFA